MHASRSETYLGPGLRPVGLCVIQNVSAVFREHCLRWHVEAARGRATVLKIKFRHSASREFDSVKNFHTAGWAGGNLGKVHGRAGWRKTYFT